MSKKIFISCDIEGTCGIAAWDETEKDKAEYGEFAEQMSKEVSSACEGCLKGGAEAILVRDAHDSARNIKPFMLPQDERVSILRGWARDPYGMMSGLDAAYDGVMFTGYHSAVGWNGNPLSHTMNTKNINVMINGEVASELMMNCLTASYLKVPVLMVTGDSMLCEWFHDKVPEAITVPVSKGMGNGSISIMPGIAVKLIREAAEKAMLLDATQCMFPLPDHFSVDVSYRQHQNARSKSWYPGARQIDSRTVRYESDNWFDVLTFFHFCL